MDSLPEPVQSPFLSPLVRVLAPAPLYESVVTSINSAKFEDTLRFHQAEYFAEPSPRKDPKLGQSLSGLLKANWPVKAAYQHPASLLLVIDWSGRGPNSIPLDLPDWKTKEATVVREVRRIKDAYRGRSLKLGVVVLIMPEEDSQLPEKLSSLKKAADLESKAILLTKETPSKINWKPLHRFLWDASLTHYKEEFERYKRLRSKATRETNLVELQVRYDFKMAFVQELRQDKTTALNYYKKAYQHLRSFSSVDYFQAQELRAVADWTVHRIISLLLSLIRGNSSTVFAEAIQTFRSHVTHFRRMASRRLLVFERLQWMTECFARFGTQLLNLPANSYDIKNPWTHPGFFFQSAFHFVQERMRLTTEDPQFIESAANWREFMVNLGLDVIPAEYLGRPPTFLANEGAEDVLESIPVEDQFRMIRTMQEADFSHLAVSMEYLVKALDFYKRTLPMPHRLTALKFYLSDMHSMRGEVPQSFALKTEIWPHLSDWGTVAKDLVKSLRSHCSTQGSTEEKVQWLLRFGEHFPDHLDKVFEAINELLSTSFVHLTPEMPRALLTVEATFSPSKLSQHEQVKICLSLRSHLPVSLPNCSIGLLFNQTQCNHTVQDRVTIEAGHQLQLETSVLAKEEGVLELTEVIVSYEPVPMSTMDFRVKTEAWLQVRDPPPKLKILIEHETVAYIADEHMVYIRLEPECTVLSGTLAIQEQALLKTYRIVHNNQEFDQPLDLPQLESEPFQLAFAFLFDNQGDHSFTVVLDYFVRNEYGQEYQCSHKHEFEVHAIPPFQAHFKVSNAHLSGLLNASFWAQKQLCKDAQVLAVTIEPLNNWVATAMPSVYPVILHEASILAFNAQYILSEDQRELQGVLVIEWSRSHSPGRVCRLPFAVALRRFPDIKLSVSTPSLGYSQQSISMQVTIANMTMRLLDASISVKETPKILLSGPVHTRVELTAQQEQVHVFSILSVDAGVLSLPVVELTYGEEVQQWSGHILIQP